MFKKNLLSTTMIVISIVGIGLGMTASIAAAGTIANAVQGNLVLRTGPAIIYKSIAIVPAGEKVHINICLSDKTWCLVNYNGMTGWAFAHYSNVKNVPIMVNLQKGQMNQMIPLKTALVLSGVNNRDERTILNPSPEAREISVQRVTAYNPLFPDNVNYRNVERNETRYRVVTYPVYQDKQNSPLFPG
ncbi:SH3 domain-containing protein [Bartonella sp. A05]|uniref:SH3 domain-containing protein n=1 Tax=Bartonella sp. A05 TaxID=2967261 RepID=UPI0022A91BBF|nr:SH3 domain-containing protein [Bartonella sp. A05]MCZ2204458.1 SH3 domain-containing protein [Bartonella sp. A05]